MIRLERHPAMPPRYVAFGEAATAMYIAAAAAVAGTAVSALGAARQAQGEQNILNYNAEVQRQEAESAQQAADVQAAEQAVKTHETIGEEIANAGASGVDPNQGSPLAVASDTATQGELQKQLIIWQGKTQQNALLNQANIDLYQGGQIRAAVPITVGSTLLTGFGRAAAIYAPQRNPPAPSSSSGTAPE